MRIDPNQIEVMDDDMVEVVRRMSGAQRLQAANAMFNAARKMIAARVGEQHPEWTEDQVRAEVARRMLRGSA